jgi:hypothetical protein
MTYRGLSARRRVRMTEPRADLDLDFSFDPTDSGTEGPSSLHSPHNQSKLNAKFDAHARPGEIIATHTFGFCRAHDRRCDAAQAMFDRTWAERERIRAFQDAKVVTHFDPGPKPKDAHVLERVLHERESERRHSSDRRRFVIDRRAPLPKEQFTRDPWPVYYV